MNWLPAFIWAIWHTSSWVGKKITQLYNIQNKDLIMFIFKGSSLVLKIPSFFPPYGFSLTKHHNFWNSVSWPNFNLYEIWWSLTFNDFFSKVGMAQMNAVGCINQLFEDLGVFSFSGDCWINWINLMCKEGSF